MSKLKTDWSAQEEVEFLKMLRTHMWQGKSLDFLKNVIGITRFTNIADIGCGYGFLGNILLNDNSKKTTYTGVDNAQGLLDLGKKEAEEWAKGKKCRFIYGDAYNLPLKDNSYDITICQTLLMHLDDPLKAVKEMLRITKPSGTIVCIEPDNTTNGLTQRYDEYLSNYDFADLAIMLKVKSCQLEGKRKLGLGDFAIGVRLPFLLNEAGLDDIKMYNDPSVRTIVLPGKYPIPEKPKDKSQNKQNANTYNKNLKAEVLAGGGSTYLLRKYYNLYKKYEQHRENVSEKYYNGTYYYCDAYPALKICIGIKPENRK